MVLLVASSECSVARAFYEDMTIFLKCHGSEIRTATIRLTDKFRDILKYFNQAYATQV